MSPPAAGQAATYRGFSTPQQSEMAASVRVLSPAGVPLPERITRADAVQRISDGIARNMTESFRKQIKTIQMLAGVAVPKAFGESYWLSEEFRNVRVDLLANGIRGGRAASRVAKCRDDSKTPGNRVLQRAAQLRDTGVTALEVAQKPWRAVDSTESRPLGARQRRAVHEYEKRQAAIEARPATR